MAYKWDDPPSRSKYIPTSRPVSDTVCRPDKKAFGSALTACKAIPRILKDFIFAKKNTWFRYGKNLKVMDFFVRISWGFDFPMFFFCGSEFRTEFPKKNAKAPAG